MYMAMVHFCQLKCGKKASKHVWFIKCAHVSDCGQITMFYTIKQTKQTKIQEFLLQFKKYGFQVQKIVFTLPVTQSNSLNLRGISQGQVLKTISKYILLILQFYFHSTKLTLLSKSKQSKQLNKYSKGIFWKIK